MMQKFFPISQNQEQSCKVLVSFASTISNPIIWGCYHICKCPEWIFMSPYSSHSPYMQKSHGAYCKIFFPITDSQLSSTNWIHQCFCLFFHEGLACSLKKFWVPEGKETKEKRMGWNIRLVALFLPASWHSGYSIL